MIKNVKHSMVQEKIENLLKTTNGCKCEKCKEDMIALALNKLKPKYVSTPMGELIERANALAMQDEIELITAVAQAIQQVHQFPRH